MLNSEGGDIILGVDDNGNITGIGPSKVEILKSNLVSQSNNTLKLDPPFILFPKEYLIEGNTIIHVQVPSSSQVHKTGNNVFDRSNDGDFRVIEPSRIAEIYNRKRIHYTEGTIYPALRFKDFKNDLFPKIRNLIRSNNANHPWLALNDEQMLLKAGLYKRDLQLGKEGYTLAAVLLLGTDEIIQHVLPHYKIDVLVRKVNTDRYDDREYVSTNLIEAYDQLMNFVAKHLPDKFFMEGDQRISLRTKIFREVVANLIVHREYTNALPATFTIYEDKVEIINANIPHGEGALDPDNFTPFPKNPIIAKFFIQLGRVDELGSGVLNVNKYMEYYAPGKQPQFVEGIPFRTIMPLDVTLVNKHDAISNGINEEISEGISEGIKRGIIENVNKEIRLRWYSIINIIEKNAGIKVKNILQYFDVSERTIKNDLSILSKLNIIVYKGSLKTGGYFIKLKK